MSQTGTKAALKPFKGVGRQGSSRKGAPEENGCSFFLMDITCKYDAVLAVPLLQRLVQHEVDLVVAEGLLEVGNVRLLVDLDVLDASHLGEVLPILLVDVVREG